MKGLIFVIFLGPFCVCAQVDTLRPIRSDTLKVISTDLVPGYGRYGRGIRARYIYDGLDVRRPVDLEKYIRASGDANANAEFDRYITRRKSSWPLILLGSGAYIGGLIGWSNATASDPNRRTITYSSPTYPYTRTSTVSDRGAAGVVIALLGVGLATWGCILRVPGQHVRSAVQYYNRSLKQRGVSWQVTPCSSANQSGIGLVARF